MRLMVMRWDTQIGNSMTGADLVVYSMHESSGSRLSLSILYDVLSWMSIVCYVLNDVYLWLFEINWDILNY